MFDVPDANSQTGRGKGKGGKKGQNGKGQKGQTQDPEDPRSKIACFFHQQEGGCRSGVGCPFKHTKLSEQEKRNLVRLGSRNREPPPNRPTAGNRRPSVKGARGIKHCLSFFSSGKCKDGAECKFPHLNEK